MEERQKIIDNILEILDTDNNIIKINDIKLEFSCNKYSSKKNSIYHISLNEHHLSKKDSYRIKYKCISCESIHIVGTTQFIRKINKCSYRCSLCCNKDFYTSYIPFSKKSLIEQKEEGIKVFNDLDEEFKENYFKYHLTDNDYKRISQHLISIENGKRIINDTLEFWPIFKTNNQMLFTSVFYDKVNDMIIRANQPIMKCQNCYNTWRCKTIEKYKNMHKIMCKDCSLCNNIFKIRTTQNNIHNIILYQSKLELKFIEWCNNSGITVINGPLIPYYFDGKERKYKIDFQVNDILIEIKDNHIWHLNQVVSGKWKAKEDAVYNEINKGLYKEYYMITPKNWVQNLNKIKQLTNKI